MNKIIIDIRKHEDYQNGHIPGAINIHFSLLLNHPDLYLDKNNTYMIYCQSGNTSKRLVNILNQNGYSCVNIDGGYTKYLFEYFNL